MGAAVAERDHQVCSFAGHVQTGGNAQSLERLLLDETLADRFEHGHLLRGPFDLALAGIGQPHVLHITFFHFSDCQSLAPQLWISFRRSVTPSHRSMARLLPALVLLWFRELAASSDFRSRGIPEASGLAESIRAVRALPGEF